VTGPSRTKFLAAPLGQSVDNETYGIDRRPIKWFDYSTPLCN